MGVREQLFRVVDRWLAIEDRQGIDTIMSVSMHILMPGDPLWLLIVNAPGTAKTELARSLRGARYQGKELVYTIDSLTPHTLVSGFMTKDKTDPSELREMNDKLVIIKDFSQILSSNWGDQKRIYADLRQAYDGYIEKPFGSGAHKRGGYSHFGLLAAATGVIDTFSILTQQLGERFLRLRLRIDEDAAVDKASEVAGQEKQMRNELGEAFRAALEHYVSHLDINSILKTPAPEEKIKALAKLIARLRSEVLRDRNRIVKVLPDPEVGTRLVKQFKALYRMSSVVLGQGSYDMVMRVAKDCLPGYRLSIVEQLKDGKYQKVQDIVDSTNIPSRTCYERLEDMQLVGAVEENKGSNPAEYRLTNKVRTFIQEAGF